MSILLCFRIFYDAKRRAAADPYFLFAWFLSWGRVRHHKYDAFKMAEAAFLGDFSSYN